MTCRILVIDDDESILFTLREYFSLLGYQVDCAKDTEEAKTFLVDRSYAVIIVDLRLSAVVDSSEGLELIKSVREGCPKTSILLLTADGNPSIELEALSRGADAFLHKPMPLPDIAHIVAGLLGARS
jgi:DNA-binding response OmpR family regulator